MRHILTAAALLVLAFAATAPAEELSTADLEKYLNDKRVFFLDVREPDEIKKLGSVKGYVNIPIGQLEKRLNEIPKDKLIITL